jgi:hypothetical protein
MPSRREVVSMTVSPGWRACTVKGCPFRIPETSTETTCPLHRDYVPPAPDDRYAGLIPPDDAVDGDGRPVKRRGP